VNGGSGTSAYVRSFDRYELKYLVGDAAARAFTAELATHASPDSHAGEAGYPVYSLYWDSPELLFFWEKLDGEKLRRKLRFRRYGGEREVFVEIKQRIDRTVQKRRTRLEVPEVLEIFDRGALGQTAAADGRDPVLQEALVLCHRHRLAPRLAVRYRRRAWFATFEPDLRVTLDSALQYESDELDLARPFESGRPILAPDRSVLEIKYNQRVPVWLVALVQKHGLEVVRFSKYCAAADLAFYGGRHGLTPS
jgi:SPX domain protein involved in polyphosphate accumulation